MITRLAQPLLALRASLGQGGDVSALSATLAAASHSIEQIAVGGQSPLAGLPQVWDGPAGAAASNRVGQLQRAAGQIADRGTRIGPIVQQAASALAADRQHLDAIISQFMSLGNMDPQVLHSASGVTAAITVANNALQQGLAVVSHAGVTLADATRALQGLTPPLDQVPPLLSGGVGPGQTEAADEAPTENTDYQSNLGLGYGSDGVGEAAAINSSDPVRAISAALTSTGARAIGEIAGYAIGDLGQVFDAATNAIGTVFDHLGSAAGTMIDQAIAPKQAGQNGAATGIGDGSTVGQAPFGPPPGAPGSGAPTTPASPVSNGKPVAKPVIPKTAPQEPFGGATNSAPLAPPAPAVQAPTGDRPAVPAPPAPAHTPDPNVPSEADGGGSVVPLPGAGHGTDGPRHREQAGVTDASMQRIELPRENALTA
jgi:hypothetical protein